MKANVLEIDLSTGESSLAEVDATRWIGGRGLATKLFVERADPAADPLGPDNVIVFAASPLTGTAAPTAGRGHVVFKSPLTGGIGSSNSGGRWARDLKGAGVDALVLRGAAERLSRISIEGGPAGPRVSIDSAENLAGMPMPTLTGELAAKSGAKTSVLGIGPAGENLVLFASIMNEKNRAYGRGGPGAALGAKRIKAVAAGGGGKTEVAEPERFKAAVEQVRHVMKAQPVTKRVLRDLGTAGLVHLINMMGMLPRRNFQDTAHDEARLDNISGETIRERILKKEGGCFGCPILCQRHTSVGGRDGEGPEYESVVLLGPLLDVYDLDRIVLANYAANELGLDTMSLGGVLAAAAELFETEALEPADFGGEAVRFGDALLYPDIVARIARREGIGGLLAGGARKMAEAAGRPGTAMAVKGLEMPAYDPRGMHAQALGYMTAPTGACHLRGGYSVQLAFFGGMKEVPRFSARQAPVTCKNQQDAGLIQDSLGICRFTGYAVGAEHWSRVYAAATGEDIGRAGLEEAAERIAAAERLFNLAAGLGRADDDLPARFRDEPIDIGGKARTISAAERDRMLDDYYEVRGWDRDGVPKSSTLGRLGLSENPGPGSKS